MNNWNENLMLIFGVKSLFEAIFIPSIRKLPMSGLEWTKMVYPSFSFEFTDLNKEVDLDISSGEIYDNLDLSNKLNSEKNDINETNLCKNYDNKSKYLDLV